MRFANVSEEVLSAAFDASVDSMKKQLQQTHRRVKEAVNAQTQLQEELDGNPSKFSIRKMATGSIDDFHKGLQDRIGERATFIFSIVFIC